MIGGPLVAVVNAQGQAALGTVNFIKQIGFRPPEGGLQSPDDQSTGEPATITFRYKKTVPTEEGGTEERDVELTVPFLAMLPIPNLRIAETNIDFLAKINSTQYRKVDQNVNITGELEARAGWGWGSARLKVTASYQRHTQEGEQVTRDYSMGVKVRAVQEETPAGLDRLLSIMESLIEERTQAA